MTITENEFNHLLSNAPPIIQTQLQQYENTATQWVFIGTDFTG